MLQTISKRMAMGSLSLLGVTVVIYLLMTVLPGDPAAAFLSPDASKAEREAVRQKLGLNDPLPVRYVRWLNDTVHGNLGHSPYRRKDVKDLLSQAWQNTAILAVASAVVGIGLGVVLGTLAGVYRDRWIDRLVSLIALTGISIPSFWVAILLLIVFSAQLRWLPTAGMGASGDLIDLFKHLIMPVAGASLAAIAVTARVTRASVVETYSADFVELLRAKGLHSWQILLHVAKNAVSPVLTTSGLQLGNLLGGAVLIETIFRWPGMGLLVFNAISARDILVVEGATLVIAATFVILNVFVDVLSATIDPRLRRGA
jgi:peptide/nickel transport system permease protein